MNPPFDLLILGSSSPRRSAILTDHGMSHLIHPSPYEEELFSWSFDPSQSIKELAIAKARPLAEQFPQRVILTADTIVLCQEGRLGKPKSREEAREYLRLLRGRWHEVYTAVCVYDKATFNCQSELTRVKIRDLTDEAIEQYIETPIPYDKAGGYAIQGIGGLLVESIEGCFYNVMGLPVSLVATLLKPTGYDLWQCACSRSH